MPASNLAKVFHAPMVGDRSRRSADRDDANRKLRILTLVFGFAVDAEYNGIGRSFAPATLNGVADADPRVLACRLNRPPELV